MSSAVEGFYNKVHSDPRLQQQLIAGANGDIEKMIGNAIAIGAGMGYQFSVDEAREFATQVEELPDDILDAINAGTPTSCNGGTMSQV